MIDFSNDPTALKTYGGVNGSKVSVMHNGERYMLKFPVQAKKNPRLHYSNSVLSEYVGCKIYSALGIDAQEVELGVYTKNNKQYLVVACKDFATGGYVVEDFASIKNTIIDSIKSGKGTELSDIIATMNEQKIMPPSALKERFWQMFVVDALIANWDRHNGNWGILYNDQTQHVKLAPVYDCGSSLFAEADKEIMQAVIAGGEELDKRVEALPKSAFMVDNNKITYTEYFSDDICDNCKRELMCLYPKIEALDIDTILDTVPDAFINDTQKAFYKTIITARQKRILQPAYTNAKNLIERRKLVQEITNSSRNAAMPHIISDNSGCVVGSTNARQKNSDYTVP